MKIWPNVKTKRCSDRDIKHPVGRYRYFHGFLLRLAEVKKVFVGTYFHNSKYFLEDLLDSLREILKLLYSRGQSILSINLYGIIQRKNAE